MRGGLARKGVIVDVHQYLRAIPKFSLHCHMEGAMRASTLVELPLSRAKQRTNTGSTTIDRREALPDA
jgi:adenosine deaminase